MGISDKSPTFSVQKLDITLDLTAEPCNNYPVQLRRTRMQAVWLK